MKSKLLLTGALIAGLALITSNGAFGDGPVNPDASPEARALLDLFYRISGRYTLTGQHNYPNTKDHNSRFAANYEGQTPAIWSTDMGFAKEGDKDSYLARPEIVREAIRQHRKGSIVTICWHAVPPTADEPVIFNSQGRGDTGSLSTVQGRLTDEQFRDLLTPGTLLYNHWAAQVDTIAVYLKMLRDARVPVLWRPYHEMNGDWFWWGGRVGENSTIDLYRQLFERLVNVHKLNNLIWVWSVDRPSTPVRKFSNFYPGNDCLDILALDVYGSDFNQAYYDSLKALSKGKPMVLGEVGNPPTPKVMDAQPGWSYWVIWAGMVRNLTREQHHRLISDPRILSQEDPAYREVTAPYRKACGLPVLPLKDKIPVSFSGNWVFNDALSDLGGRGRGNVIDELEVDQDGEVLFVKQHIVSEWGDDDITTLDIYCDGSETRSAEYNSPLVSVASWDEDSRSIVITTTATFEFRGQKRERNSRETWRLDDDAQVLTIERTSQGFRGGENTVRLVYDKQ